LFKNKLFPAQNSYKALQYPLSDQKCDWLNESVNISVTTRQAEEDRLLCLSARCLYHCGSKVREWIFSRMGKTEIWNRLAEPWFCEESLTE